MGFFSRFFAKGESVPRELRPVFEEMRRNEEGRKLADQAISYRNVGNFDKALKLLMQALSEFGYDPAIILIGTTAVKKGNVAEAVRWFELQIKAKEKSRDFPLIELYANLGSIYHKHYQDDDKALAAYANALRAPRPSVYDEVAYSHMESNVYHDMAVVYSKMDDFIGARRSAEKCVRLRPDCPVCGEIAKSISLALNASGELVAAAVRMPDGRYIQKAVKGQPNSLWYSTALVFAHKLKAEDRIVFCRWAGLQEHEWTASHIELCALVMMHYFCTANELDPSAPDAIRNAAKFIVRDQLPPLDRPLNDEIKTIYNRAFGGGAGA
jgi:tetratricopeptide (TPR) repeat protein